MWKKIFRSGSDTKEDAAALMNSINRENLPRHVAIIMDGNGRWAKRRGMPRTYGHNAGVKTLKKILKTANSLGIEVLTVYAFSTENWKRPHTEVDCLMQLFAEYLDREMQEMNEDNVRIHFIGRTDAFSPLLRDMMTKAETMMAGNSGIHFNVAVNYGARDEIVRAVQSLMSMSKAGEMQPEDLTEELFDASLDTSGDPPVDLLIRTGGDLRLSNYLLWQCAYAELWFTDTNWPAFSPEEFLRAIQDFSGRHRRFGGLDDE